jgi:hypothetical protein
MKQSQSIIFTMQGWAKVANGQGRAHLPGARDGWYVKEGQRVFFKQNASRSWFTGRPIIHSDKMICEVVAAEIMRLINADTPSFFANVQCALSPEIDPAEFTPTNETGKYIYIASRSVETTPQPLTLEQQEDVEFRDLYIAYTHIFGLGLGSYEQVHAELYGKGCQDLYKDAYLAYNFAPQFEPLRSLYGPIKIPQERPLFAGTINKEPLKSVMLSNRYIGFHRILAASLFVDDPDTHAANLMAVPLDVDWDLSRKKGNPHYKKLVRIDTGEALSRLDGTQHLNDFLRYLPLMGPTNHNREYANEMVIHPALAEEEERIANLDEAAFRVGVKKILGNVVRYFGPKDLLAFALRLGVGVSTIKDKNNSVAIAQAAESFLIQQELARRESARRLARDIKLSEFFVSDAEGFFVLSKKESNNLVRFAKNNREYFLACFYGQAEFNFLVREQDRQCYRLTQLLNKKSQDIFPELQGQRSLVPLAIQVRGVIRWIAEGVAAIVFGIINPLYSLFKLLKKNVFWREKQPINIVTSPQTENAINPENFQLLAGSTRQITAAIVENHSLEIGNDSAISKFPSRTFFSVIPENSLQKNALPFSGATSCNISDIDTRYSL